MFITSTQTIVWESTNQAKFSMINADCIFQPRLVESGCSCWQTFHLTRKVSCQRFQQLAQRRHTNSSLAPKRLTEHCLSQAMHQHGVDQGSWIAEKWPVPTVMAIAYLFCHPTINYFIWAEKLLDPTSLSLNLHRVVNLGRLLGTILVGFVERFVELICFSFQILIGSWLCHIGFAQCIKLGSVFRTFIFWV